MLITEPGVYDIPSEVYHADPCQTPSLSAGGIKALTEECPRLFWEQTPRLNPNADAKESAAFDIGRAAHLAYLEPEAFSSRTVIIDAADYKTKAAQAERDAARAVGKTPLLPKDVDMINRMREEIDRSPIARDAFAGEGNAEQSAFAKDPETGVWLRIRPDYATPDYLVDYKTSTSANPADFSRASYTFGYHQRAAFYLDVWELATGRRPDEYWFVVQSKAPPHLVTVIRLANGAIEIGAEQNRIAINTFARCLGRGTDLRFWPGYRRPDHQEADAAFTVDIPIYAHAEIGRQLDAIEKGK